MHIFTPRTAALLLALAATSAQAATFDYFESFDDESTFTQSTTLPDGWTSLATTQSIQRYKGSMLGSGAHSGSYVLGTLPSTSVNRNDWAFTRMMKLRAGVTYKVSFWLYMPGGSNPAFNNQVTLSAGTAQTATACTTVLGTTGATTISQWTLQSYEFTPTADGEYCFGINIATPLYQAGSVAIDDFSVTGNEPDDNTDLPAPDPDKTVVELPYSQSFDNENKDYDGTTYVPAGWLSVGDFPFRTANIEGIKAKDGTYYAIAPESSMARSERLYTSFFPLIKGTTYTVNFYLYMPGGEEGRSDFDFTVGEEQDADLHTSLLRLDSVSTDGWMPVKVTFTPDHSAYYCFSFAPSGATPNAGEVGIDLFTVTAPGLVARPRADFAFNGTYSQMNSHLTLVDGQTIQMIDRSTAAETHRWDIPGANPDWSDEANPTFSFPNSGIYQARLKVTNEKGESTTTQTLTVDVVSEASSLPLTVFDPTNEPLMTRDNIPYFSTAENADYATGVNHYYRAFAERFFLPDEMEYSISGLTLFLCHYNLSNAIEGVERKKTLRVALYPDVDGRPDTEHPYSAQTFTLEEAFGTMGLSKAEMRTLPFKQPLTAKGPFFLAFEFDPTLTLDLKDTQLSRTIVGLGGFYHRSGQTSFFCRPDSVPAQSTFQPDGSYCPVDSVDADLAGLGLNVTAWMSIRRDDGTPESIAIAPNGSRPFAARFNGNIIEVSGTHEGQPISLTDLNGRTLFRTTAHGTTLTLSANGLPHGTYLVNGCKIMK